jgi:hypothetical protein
VKQTIAHVPMLVLHARRRDVAAIVARSGEKRCSA